MRISKFGERCTTNLEVVHSLILIRRTLDTSDKRRLHELKDAGAKQNQDRRDRFNHFDAPVFTLQNTSDTPRLFQDRFINPT